ncbi:MAG: double-cubane-cluster-containing anaerobic reductase [Chloroflexota bacterium]|nr:double-cubane-cluster-containing anaerobic reductase [Chloroflexota bacterium]
MTDYNQMWADLGMDLERHDVLMCALPAIYKPMFLDRENRPKAMEYFDYVVSEIHGLRIQEIMEHKAKGGTVVGAFCVYVPEEMVIAADGICVGLCAGAEISVGSAEEILPRNLCPLIKSAVGFRLERICPYFQACDLVVGETTCDGKKKAWEVLADYAPMYVMELPQKKGDRDKALWTSELFEFKDKLEELTSNQITEDSLGSAIALVDAKRAALQRLYDLRKASPSPISGLDSLLIAQVYFNDDPARFTAKTNELCDELETRMKENGGVQESSVPRILISGCPMIIPNWKVPYLVENCGASVVCEESCTGTRLLTGNTNVKGNGVESQISAIAERQLKTNCACFTPNDDRINDVLNLCDEYNVDGVIHYSMQFCQPYMVEAEKIKKALGEKGIPMLALETDYGDGDTGQLRTRIEAFLEQVSK